MISARKLGVGFLLAIMVLPAACGNSALEQGLRADRAGNTKEAFAAYSQAIDSLFMVSNKRAKAYAGRAGIYIEQRKLKLAMADLDKALEQDAQCSAAYYNRAILYILLGEPKKAQGDATRLVELDPQDPAVRRLLIQLETPGKGFDLPLNWCRAHNT